MVERPFPPLRRRPVPPRMRPRLLDGWTRVALAIVGAFVGTIAYREFARHRDIAEAQAAIQSIADTANAAMQRNVADQQAYQQQAARQEAAARRDAYEAARYVLADDQQCVGGAVVEVHGSTYTQVGSIQDPVHCAGRRADRPLR